MHEQSSCINRWILPREAEVFDWTDRPASIVYIALDNI